MVVSCRSYRDVFDAMPSARHRLFAIPALLALGITAIALLGGNTLASDERHLSFYHTHTGERLDVVYARNGNYVLDALDEINHFLSDFRTGDVVEIDPELLDLIYDVRQSLGSAATYQVISAYRSPKTNEMLRNRNTNSGVATKSQHLLGKAIDVRLSDRKLVEVHDAALKMQAGGVGLYTKSDFLHLDTGRVRRWGR